MGSFALGDSTLPEARSGRLGRTADLAWGIQWAFPISSTGITRIAEGAVLRVGRERGCDVVFDDHLLSRSHARFHCSAGQLSVSDADSRNGTIVNGVRVARATLAPGDVIRLGSQIGIAAWGSEAELLAPSLTRVSEGFWAGPTLRRALATLKPLASTNLPIVVEGETGTGKERVARAIHELSGRIGAFVGINCAAIPENLAEAELFGYRRGAFTGAEQAASGFFLAANGGTLLLDEVCDLPLALQAKLLRVLEQGEVQRLGENHPTPIDVRIVVAARSPLAEQVKSGRCRADFAVRLTGGVISLPGLRHRKEELPGLFMQLLSARLGGPAPEVETQLVEHLVLYDWPGNVRELDLQARRLLGLHGHEGKLRASHLSGTAIESACSASQSARGGPPRDARETQALLAALRQYDGNLTKASASVSMSRQRAYRLLEAANADLEALRRGA